MLKLSDLNVCSKDDFVAALANVFEHSPWVAGQVVALRPFAGSERCLQQWRRRSTARPTNCGWT